MSWLSNHELDAILTGEEKQQEDGEVKMLRTLNTNCDMCLEFALQQELDWGGVYPIDKLPPVPPAWPDDQKTISYIFNTATSKTSGQHWVAVRVLPGMIEYFDSYGQPPSTYPAIWSWIVKARGGRSLLSHLKLRLQGPKAYCGAYCVYFLCERIAHCSLYDTFFSTGYVFRALDSNVQHDSSMIRDYLSLNDKHVFNYLLARVNGLLHYYDQ